jgi:DNA repair protein RecN (Recombination protein N)
MLKSLYIQNYAIIDELLINFAAGMNVITGETGAGKSILMGALSLILGERADTGVLLDRNKKCIVEGVFEAEGSEKLLFLLQQHDLFESSSDTELVIRRELSATGKSRAFINDTPVNLEQLRQVTSLVVDLHRQFDTLTLAESDFQLNVLDALAGNHSLLKDFQQHYRTWKGIAGELERLKSEKNTFTKEFDYNKFLFDELEEASFKEHELEDAELELKLLSNAEGIKRVLSAAVASLSESDDPLLQQMKSIHHQIDSFSQFHSRLGDLAARVKSVQIELQDISDELSVISEEVNYDERRIEQLNERLSTGYKLLKKHGVQNTAQLLQIQQELSAKLGAILNVDEEIAKRENAVAEERARIDQLATALTAQRSKQITSLEQRVNKLLIQVGMPNARLSVQLVDQQVGSMGKDNVEFLFDANKSNRFEPLRKVASGGELSRLMLCIKSLVAESMDMPTLIFDEIDTGISGEAAKQVGVIMQALAQKRQIITITHQPQIAGKANAHLFVYKDARKDVVRTGIRLLDREERVVAIAKMLSGEKPTAAALENAREMVMN